MRSQPASSLTRLSMHHGRRSVAQRSPKSCICTSLYIPSMTPLPALLSIHQQHARAIGQPFLET